MTILPLEYYQHHDVLFISEDLLGKYLLTNIGSVITGGMIIETEAYRGPEDRASHAYGNRRTKRTSVMYSKGGVCYVYQCYGIHLLFNVITSEADIPHAVLIRAIEPSIGVEEMLKRRGKSKLDHTLTNGPGSLTKALGITLKHNGYPLIGPEIWIEKHCNKIYNYDIIKSPRVGIDYAGEDALLPWRFRLKKK